MDPLQFTWDFNVKETPGISVPILPKAHFFLLGDRQKAFRDLDPSSLYAQVSRNETIRTLLAKFSAQYLLLKGADISNAYLHGDLETPVLMHQPTNLSQRL